MNVHGRRRHRYLGIDLILDTGGVFGSLPPLALPRVIGGDAGVVIPPARAPADPPAPPSGESNSPPSLNTSLRRVAAGVVAASSEGATEGAGNTRDRVGFFFLGAAGGSGRSSRPGRVGWLIGGVADIVSSFARNLPGGRNLLSG